MGATGISFTTKGPAETARFFSSLSLALHSGSRTPDAAGSESKLQGPRVPSSPQAPVGPLSMGMGDDQGGLEIALGPAPKPVLRRREPSLTLSGCQGTNQTTRLDQVACARADQKMLTQQSLSSAAHGRAPRRNGVYGIPNDGGLP